MGDESEERFWEDWATDFIVAVMFPVLVIIGTIGNTLTFNIMHRTTLGDRSAASWMFKCLAIMCMLCLWLGLPRHWLKAVYDFDIRKSHFLVCKLHRFFLYTVMDITAWVIVFVSIDRLITVFSPSLSNKLCTSRNAKNLFLVLNGVFAVFNIHIFWAYGREYSKKPIPLPKGRDAATSDAKQQFIWSVASECKAFKDDPALTFYSTKIHPYVSFVIVVVVPFFLMLVCSILIAKKVAWNRELIKEQISKRGENRKKAKALVSTPSVSSPTTPRNQFILAQQQRREDEQANLERTTTRLTIATSVEFVLTATPAFVLDMAEPYLKGSEFFTTPRGKAQFNLMYTSVRLLLFSNFALHFFLFCLTVGRFRKEFKKLVRVWQSFIMIEQRVPVQDVDAVILPQEQMAQYHYFQPTIIPPGEEEAYKEMLKSSCLMTDKYYPPVGDFDNNNRNNHSGISNMATASQQQYQTTTTTTAAYQNNIISNGNIPRNSPSNHRNNRKVMMVKQDDSLQYIKNFRTPDEEYFFV